MQKEKSSILKSDLRHVYKARRKEISPQRREEAKEALLSAIPQSGGVLSFFSFGSEIDLSEINATLCLEKRLYLPRIEGNNLVVYPVISMQTLEKKETFAYKIFEPPPLSMEIENFPPIETILVPALAFDAQGYRLGMGKGFYDRFLATQTGEAWGVGFLEQFTHTPLPRDPWDIPVQKLLLT